MLTYDEALERVSIRISEYQEPTGLVFVVLEDQTLETPYGWVFFYTSQEFIDTGEFKYALAGNAPIIVDKFNDALVDTGTAYRIEHYLQGYEKSRSTTKDT